VRVNDVDLLLINKTADLFCAEHAE
jgi:hypothetical protein